MGEVVEYPRGRGASPASPALAAIEQLREAIAGSPWAASAAEKTRIELAIDRLVVETMGLDGGQAARLQRIVARLEAKDALERVVVGPIGSSMSSAIPPVSLWPWRMTAPETLDDRRAREADIHRRALELGARLAEQRRTRAFVVWMRRPSPLARLRMALRRRFGAYLRPSLLERIFPDAA